MPRSVLRADRLSLHARITFVADDGNWVTGKVVELALIGDEMRDIRITLQLDNGATLWFNRAPEYAVIHEM